jgi:long-chain acyl-CoA synthetase
MSKETTAVMTISCQQADARLIGSGLPFEIETVDIAGVPTRAWKNAPPSLRAIFEASAEYGDREALIYEDERWSYAAHHRAVCRFAWALREDLGVGKGDRVAIAMRNVPEWSVAFWAATSIGAVAVPLNAWWTGEELHYGLTDSGAEVAVVDRERLSRIEPHLADLPLRCLIVAKPGEGGLPQIATSLEQTIGSAPSDAALPDVDLAPEDDATIFYTSGTTGFPKGALGSHRNICSNVMTTAFTAAQRALRNGVEPAVLGGEKVFTASLLSVPFFHATGCHSFLAPSVLAGGKLVMMHRWSPEHALELIEREQINTFGGVPGMVWQVLEHPDFARYDTSSVAGIGYGGAPSAPDLVRKIGGGFPQADAANGYGLTETSSVTTTNRGADYRRKPDSVGPAVPVCTVKITDDDGNEVPLGEIGEIRIAGPNVVKGYWRKPEATAETFIDGWLKTGDLGRMDDEGFVYILDRAKDMLIRGGENVYCVEVEDALYGHPAVMDAAVVGRPHKILGEEVCAVVQLAAGRTADEAELIAHCREHIAAFKVPVLIDCRDEPLPRNANGKIIKHQLKEELFGPAS